MSTSINIETASKRSSASSQTSPFSTFDDHRENENSKQRYEYHFDPVIAHNIGAVDGTGIITGHVATQNNRGYQMSTLSPLYKEWIEGGKALQFSHPIVDIGCAFGVNTLTALFRDDVPYVVGMDMTQSHLDYVQEAYKLTLSQRNEVGSTQRSDKSKIFLQTSIGVLPYLDGAKSESYSSILCAEVIHFLNGDELPIAFKRFYEVLVPGGQLQLTCASVDARGTIENFSIRDLINEKKKQNPNNQWPGYFDGDEMKALFKYIKSGWNSSMTEEAFKASSFPMLHYFTASQVAKLAEDAGFIVKSIKTTTHPGHPPAAISEFSSIQLVAIKL